MKNCKVCKLEKEDTQFSFRNKTKGTRHNICKLCATELSKTYYVKDKPKHRQNTKKHIAKRKEWFNNLKEKPCVDCGIQYHWHVMDFDHLPQFEKKFELAEMRRNNMSKSKILEEVSKCDVICSNCHRLRTVKRWAQKSPSAT